MEVISLKFLKQFFQRINIFLHTHIKLILLIIHHIFMQIFNFIKIILEYSMIKKF